MPPLLPRRGSRWRRAARRQRARLPVESALRQGRGCQSSADPSACSSAPSPAHPGRGSGRSLPSRSAAAWHAALVPPRSVRWRAAGRGRWRAAGRHGWSPGQWRWWRSCQRCEATGRLSGAQGLYICGVPAVFIGSWCLVIWRRADDAQSRFRCVHCEVLDERGWWQRSRPVSQVAQSDASSVSRRSSSVAAFCSAAWAAVSAAATGSWSASARDAASALGGVFIGRCAPCHAQLLRSGFRRW